MNNNVSEKDFKNSKITKDTLFDNPEVERLKNTLSQEYQQNAKEKGEELFKMNFETGKLENDSDPLLEQIKLMLKTMHPSYLNSDEIDYLVHKLGDKWWETFGFFEIDVKRINF